MNDTQKMFQTIINGQSAFRQEVFGKFDKLEKKVDKLDEKLTKRIDDLDNKLTNRIDSLGKQLAYLEDDAPTRDEFNELEKRVDKVEQKTL